MTTIRSILDQHERPAPESFSPILRAESGPVLVTLAQDSGGSPLFEIHIKRAEKNIATRVRSLADLVNVEVGREFTGEEAERVHLAIAKLFVMMCPNARTLR